MGQRLLELALFQQSEAHCGIGANVAGVAPQGFVVIIHGLLIITELFHVIAQQEELVAGLHVRRALRTRCRGGQVRMIGHRVLETQQRVSGRTENRHMQRIKICSLRRFGLAEERRRRIGVDGFAEDFLASGGHYHHCVFVLAGGRPAEFGLAAVEIQVERPLQVSEIIDTDIPHREPEMAVHLGFPGENPVVVGLVVAVGAGLRLEIRQVAIGEDLFPDPAAGRGTPGPELLAADDCRVAVVDQATFFLRAVATEIRGVRFPGEETIGRFDVLPVPHVSAVIDRPVEELVFAVTGDDFTGDHRLVF